MDELVMVKNNQVVVSSRQIAESFHKLHKSIVRSIKDILAAQNCATKFFKASYYVNRGKKYIEYLMNRDGFVLLVMGFTGKVALDLKVAYINAFNEMEAKLREIQKPKQTLPIDLPKTKEWVRPYQNAEYAERINEIKAYATTINTLAEKLTCVKLASENQTLIKIVEDVCWQAGLKCGKLKEINLPTYPTIE